MCWVGGSFLQDRAAADQIERIARSLPVGMRKSRFDPIGQFTVESVLRKLTSLMLLHAAIDVDRAKVFLRRVAISPEKGASLDPIGMFDDFIVARAHV